MSNFVLEVNNLRTHFFTMDGIVPAVDGVSFHVARGETLGIVGESGCGKSITSLSILRLVPHPGRIVDGSILYYADPGSGPIDLVGLPEEGPQIRSIRGKEIAMIFQEPMSSLSPVHTIGNQIIEAIRIHNREIGQQAARQMAVELLAKVGIPRPEERIDNYTFELSGGMRQRAMIAMALSCNPKLLIADEPTTAVDVTIQAQVLDLLSSLQQELGMSMLIITHDLGVIAEMADRVVVMYLGKVVEIGTTLDLFDSPLHPYTQALLKSIPTFDTPERELLAVIEGTVPNPGEPVGCEFASRCPAAMDKCHSRKPGLIELEADHFVRCFLYSDEEETASRQEKVKTHG